YTSSCLHPPRFTLFPYTTLFRSIDAHPALKAASPQAPMGDNGLGDDMHHNGAFWLPHAFNFISTFSLQPPVPTMENGPAFVHGRSEERRVGKSGELGGRGVGCRD